MDRDEWEKLLCLMRRPGWEDYVISKQATTTDGLFQPKTQNMAKDGPNYLTDRKTLQYDDSRSVRIMHCYSTDINGQRLDRPATRIR